MLDCFNFPSYRMKAEYIHLTEWTARIRWSLQRAPRSLADNCYRTTKYYYIRQLVLMSSATAIPMYLPLTSSSSRTMQLSLYISQTLSVSCLFDYVQKCCFDGHIQGQILNSFIFHPFLSQATLQMKSIEVNN